MKHLLTKTTILFLLNTGIMANVVSTTHTFTNGGANQSNTSGVQTGHDKVEISYSIEILSNYKDDIVINEVQVDPVNEAYGATFSEFIEITNTSLETIDLNGFTVSTNSGSETIDESILIGSGEYIVFGKYANSLMTLGVELDWAWGLTSSLELDATTDLIKIVDANGYIVDSLSYASSHPYSSGTSMELKNPLLNNDDVSNWTAATVSYDSEDNLGSPAAINEGAIDVPGISMSPAVADVGSVWEGESETLDVYIHNSGEADLTISAINNDPLTVDESDVFTYTLPTLPLTISSGDSSLITVSFTPPALESYADSLILISDAARDDTLHYRIQGMGGLPGIQINTADVFADSVLVPASGSAYASISNTGGYPLIISAASFNENPSDFSMGSTLPFTVDPFSTDSLVFTFTPTTAFLIADTVTLTSNDPGNESVTINLSGYGQMAEMTLSHDTLTFPVIHSDQTLDQFILVNNTGNGALTVSSASSSSGSFTPESGPWTIEPGSADTVTLTFTPSYVGDYTGTLTLVSNDPITGTQTVALEATTVTPTIVFIPLDSPTIQGGIELAEAGDTVLVGPGYYGETINTLGKQIYLMSEDGPENTIITGPNFGNGTDGDIVVNSGDTFYTDAVRTSVLGSNPSGQQYLDVTDASGFEVGDEVLIMTMGHNEVNEESNLTGQHETRIIKSISGNTLEFWVDLANDYSVAYADTFQGVFNTENNSYYSSMSNNYTRGYDIVFYDKIRVSKLKVYRNSTKWSLWDRQGNLIYEQNLTGTTINGNAWYEFNLDEELIIEPGEYRISTYSSESLLYRYAWGYGGEYYQSFRHGVIELTYYANGDGFPNNGFDYFRNRGIMVDFEYELVEPTLKHQVVRIPQYRNIENNGTISAYDWDGKTGGICYFRVRGELVNNGSINVNSKGYRGGDGNENYQYDSAGWRGEGIYGVPEGPANNGQFNYYSSETGVYYSRLNAGGGARQYGGGGGGSYSTNGGNGWNNWGEGASSTGSPDLAKLYFGGGGGSGGMNTDSNGGEFRGEGGDGGGILAVFAQSIINNGSMESNGSEGIWYGSSHYPSGGDGAGGSIKIMSSLFQNNSTLDALGANNNHSYSGGYGGDGRIRIDTQTDEFFGTISPTPGYTVIADYTGNSMVLDGGESAETLIQGFTFGGIKSVVVDSSDATFLNCVFQNSVFTPEEESSRNTDLSALALAVNGGSPVFRNVTFTDQAFEIANVGGTGAYITLASDSVTFIDSHFDRLKTVVSGDATQRHGNVIYQDGGAALFDNCSFDENTLSGLSSTQNNLKGNVFYLTGNGEAYFNNCSIDSNVYSVSSATGNGGVFYVNNGHISADSTSFNHNRMLASDAGASGGIFYLNSGSVTLTDSEIKYFNSNEDELVAGGLVYGPDDYSLTWNNVIADSNHTSSQIRGNSGSMTVSMTASDITGSTGDVIDTDDSITLTLDHVDILNNTGHAVRGNGPKSFSYSNIKHQSSYGVSGSGSVTLQTSSIDSNGAQGITGATGTITADSTTIAGNTGQAIVSTSILEFTDVTVTGNGAGISSSGSATFEDVTLSNNAGYGLMSNGDKVFTDVTISNNAGHGVSGSGSVTLSRVTVRENDQEGFTGYTNTFSADTSTIVANGNGGMSHFEDVNVTLNSCRVDSNSASSHGGGIDGRGSLTLNKTQVIGNSGYSGGGIDYTGTIELNNTNVLNNSASNIGGGIYLEGTGSADSSSINHNESVEGGGIYCIGDFEFSSTSIDSNTATFSLTDTERNDHNNGGGGVFILGDIEFDDSHVRGNSANNNGGGLLVEGSLTADHLTLSQNTATAYGGGLLVFENCTLDSSSVLNNTAGNHGGGLASNNWSNYSGSATDWPHYDGYLSITYSEISDNTSAGDGGGIFWDQNQINIERSDIRRNQANRGGGIFDYDADNPIFQYNVVSDNHAETSGGGFYLYSATTPIIFNVTAVNNTANVLGAGMLCSSTNSVVQNSIFYNNQSTDGVQIHLQGSSEIFVLYSDIAGGEAGIIGFDDIIYTNNIDQNPDFIDPDNEDYALLITSPVIDAGNPNAPEDPDGTVADMGAYYFAQDGIPNIETDVSLLEFSGVALNSSFSVDLPIQNQGLADLVVSGITFSNDAFSTTDSAFTVASMATFDVDITFRPTEEGIQNGTITFINNDPDEDGFVVALHGAGDGLAVNSVTDIPDDQGGMVGVAWHRNVFDGFDGTETIEHYNIWRRYDNSRQQLSDSAVTMDWPPLSRDVTDTETWEMVGTTPAMEFENYAFSAPTWFDSVDYNIPWTVFLVSAHTEDANVFYVSEPDSGYSIDNIAPEFGGGLSYTYGDGVVNVYYGLEENDDVALYEIKKNGSLYIETENPFFADSAAIGELISYEIRGTDESGNVGSWSEPIIVINGALGDLTWDNTIDILDVIRVVYVILHPEENYTEGELWAGDFNEDGSINIGDVPLIVDIIMGGSLSQMVYEPGIVTMYREDQTIYMNAETPVAGMQMTLTQNSEPVNISGLESAWFENRGLIFTMSDQVLLGENIPIMVLPDGVEIESMILVNHLGETIDAMLDVDPEVLIPDRFIVHQNYPNPFNPVTTIQVDLDKDTDLSIDIFDLMGRNIKTVTMGSMYAGYHHIKWYGDNNLGLEVASGTYFILVKTPEHQEIIKAVYLR